MNYSLLERTIANNLSRFPVFKQCLKRIYTVSQYAIFHSSTNIIADSEALSAFPNGDETFFGYYDKSPVNSTNKWLLAHRSSIPTRTPPDPNHPVEILLKSLTSGSTIVVDKSQAYNWQQGSRLQWLSDNTFIYNNWCRSDQKYISKIFDINSNTFKTIPWPIYDCTDKFALSLDFKHLDKFRPEYGYRAHLPVPDGNYASEFGLTQIDLERASFRELINLNDIAKNNPKFDRSSDFHKINHIMICPNQQQAMFLHRWFKDGQKYDGLAIIDLHSGNLRFLKTGLMVSHCCWLDDNRIFGYFESNTGTRGYHIINIDDSYTNTIPSSSIQHLGDGHPTHHKGLIIIDTYPSRNGMQELWLVDTNSYFTKKIGSVLHPIAYFGETRCDLHPRWSRDGNSIFIDTVMNGSRQLVQLPLSPFPCQL